MKTIYILVILLFTSISLYAQPCKLVKPGMNKVQVIELVGEPDEVSYIGRDGDVEISVWLYGNQRISFIGDSVDNVIADGKGFDELAMHVARKELTPEQFEARLEELNRVACK